MAKKTKISSLPPEKLGHLLNLCSEKDQADKGIDQNQKMSEALEDLLASTLPSSIYDSTSVKDELSHLCNISGLAHGDSIRNILLNPQTDIALIQKIKDYAKNLSKKGVSEVEKDTASTVYYAAIASALVYHDKRITKFSVENLQQTFSDLSKRNWVPSDLKKLFKEAEQYCQNNLDIEKKGGKLK